MSAPQLLRFVCENTAEGIFQSAHELHESGVLDTQDRDDLAELLTSFEKNLATPHRFVRTTSKGHYRREAVAISWFKDDARACVQRAWKLVRMLERSGVIVECVRTTQPGYVTYEDEHQVTAIPFVDR